MVSLCLVFSSFLPSLKKKILSNVQQSSFLPLSAYSTEKTRVKSWLSGDHSVSPALSQEASVHPDISLSLFCQKSVTQAPSLCQISRDKVSFTSSLSHPCGRREGRGCRRGRGAENGNMPTLGELLPTPSLT